MSKAATIARQTKTFPFQTKDFNDEKGIISGYLSTFDNIDDQGDRVRPGAFKRTLQNKYEYKKVNNRRYILPLLWQHDPHTPIGGYLSAAEDKIGLFVELELDLDVQKGKEAYSALKKGYVFQQSIGYDTIKSDYVQIDGKMIRDLVEIRLWEGSLVTFPANEEAVVTDVKGKQAVMQKKTVTEHYAEEMCKDLLEDWRDVFLCTITKSVLDAFKNGDQPEQDISQAIDEWKQLVMTKFVAESIECNLAQYISNSGYSYSPADYIMQYGSDSQSNYGWMSSNRDPNQKAGKPISSANQQKIDDHIKNLNNMADDADKAVKSMQIHVKAVRTAADDFATGMQGAEKPYEGDDPGKPTDGQPEGKSNPATPSQQEARSSQTHPQKSTVDEDERELELALASLVQDMKL